MRWFKKKFNHQLSINCNELSEGRNDYMYCFLALLHKGWASIMGLTLMALRPCMASKNTSERRELLAALLLTQLANGKDHLAELTGSLSGETIQPSHSSCWGIASMALLLVSVVSTVIHDPWFPNSYLCLEYWMAPIEPETQLIWFYSEAFFLSTKAFV